VYLNRAIWTNQSPVTLVIDERPLYERYTDEVMRLKATGKNCQRGHAQHRPPRHQ
jgi:hypothetical protein